MDIENIQKQFAEFEEKRQALAKELQKQFPSFVKPFFDKHPWIECFSWRQCEPWRDGDETEFEVLHDADQLYINELNTYDEGVYGNEEKIAVYKELSNFLSGIPIETMKALFGESNEVEVKRSGEIFVTEYNDG